MKVIKIIINGILSVIIAITLVIVLLLLIGIHSYVVLSGSMEPKIETGSLCFINKLIKFENIKEQDVIAYEIDNGTIVTHRVVEVNDDEIVTKGDANDFVDGTIVTKDNYVGKSIFTIPKIGYLVRMFQTRNGKIISISVIILMFTVAFLFGEKKENKKENNEM